jgi:hypothetical protein
MPPLLIDSLRLFTIKFSFDFCGTIFTMVFRRRFTLFQLMALIGSNPTASRIGGPLGVAIDLAGLAPMGCCFAANVIRRIGAWSIGLKVTSQEV